MAQAQSGDTVQIHYTGKLEDGTVFDSSQERDPLEFTLGSGQVIPGFDAGVLGMEIGENKQVSIEPEDAYGPTNPEMVLRITKDQFPEHITPEEGLQLQLSQPDGGAVNVLITSIEGDEVTLDGNHPLAGKKLIFDLQLVAIQ